MFQANCKDPSAIRGSSKLHFIQCDKISYYVFTFKVQDIDVN